MIQVKMTWSLLQSNPGLLHRTGAHHVPWPTRRRLPEVSLKVRVFSQFQVLGSQRGRAQAWPRTDQTGGEMQARVQLVLASSPSSFLSREIAAELNDLFASFDMLNLRSFGYGHSFGVLSHYYGREEGLELREDIDTVLEPGMVSSIGSSQVL